jgi:diguanylate cyclase (GGDEF)-like protein
MRLNQPNDLKHTMSDHISKQGLQRQRLTQLLGFPFARLGWIACWPLLGILAAFSIWQYASAQLGKEHAAAELIAQRETTGLAAAYAQQLSHTVDQLDQSLLMLKFLCEQDTQQLALLRQVVKGLYPSSAHLYASVYDAQGALVISTMTADRATNIANENYFLQHAQRSELGLRIGKQGGGASSNRSVVRFSRRFNTADGRFNGIVSIAVEPRYLGSFYDQMALGRGDFVTVRSTEGAVLSTKMGENIQGYTGIFRKPPVFASATGAAHYAADYFADNEARLYAWQTLQKYPLISTVGLLESDIYAAVDKKSDDYRRSALIALVGWAAFVVLGMAFNIFWLQRRYQVEAGQRSYRLAIEGSREGFFSLRMVYSREKQLTDFIIEDCNQRGADLVGYRRETMLGARGASLYTPSQMAALLQLFAAALDSGFFEDEFQRPATLPGTTSWVNRRLVRSGDGLALTLRDISQAKQHEADLRQLVNCDALTGLSNRYWLMQYLPRALERARQSQKNLALLFIDLDDFKAINNTLGHGAGDQLLRLAAQRFQLLVRPQDHVVRLAGDEFTIILEEVGRLEIVNISERIIAGFREPFEIDGRPVNTVHASIGIAIFPEDGDDTETLLKHADDAMYRAKHDGKGHYQFYRTVASAEADPRQAGWGSS